MGIIFTSYSYKVFRMFSQCESHWLISLCKQLRPKCNLYSAFTFCILFKFPLFQELFHMALFSLFLLFDVLTSTTEAGLWGLIVILPFVASIYHIFRSFSHFLGLILSLFFLVLFDVLTSTACEQLRPVCEAWLLFYSTYSNIS